MIHKEEQSCGTAACNWPLSELQSRTVVFLDWSGTFSRTGDRTCKTQYGSKNNPQHKLYGPAHHRPEDFENGACTLKTHQMFSIDTTPEKFDNATITVSLDVSIENACLCIHRKRIAGDSNSSSLWPFRKAPFSWRISVDGRPNRRNKVAFSNSSCV